jgi:hypothetical protein
MTSYKYYMAIDPGKSAGVVILPTASDTPAFLGKLDGSNLESVYEALCKIQKAFPELQAIGVEAQFSTIMGGSAASVRKFASSVGWIAGVCRCLWPTTPLFSIQPTGWTTGTRQQGLPKKERLENFMRQAGIPAGKQPKAATDVADAFFMAKYLRNHTTTGKLSGPKY